jgi:ABC-type transport system involved in multi-copper enzyme maturation permease subunit
MSAILGPVCAKEMVELARRKRYYVNRVLYGAVLLFTLFIVWESHSWEFRTRGTLSIATMARMAKELFAAVSGVQYGAVFLLVPVFVCGVIAEERERGTLELLFTTNLKDREIVFGKLASRVAMLLLLILTALPTFSLIMFFGGIEPGAVWRVLACTLLAVAYTGAHAIYFSAATKSTVGALVRTYWWMAVWLLGLPLMVMIPISSSRNFGAIQFFTDVLLFLNPVFTFGMVLSGEGYNFMAARIGAWFFPVSFALPLAWSIVLMLRAVKRLRQEARAVAIPRIRRRRESRVPAESDEFELHAKRSTVKSQRKARRGWATLNPLWLRSKQARVYDREGYIGRIQWAGWAVAAIFLTLLLLFEPKGSSQHESGMGFLTPTWIGVAALVALFSATSLVGDRRRGFLELVLLSPLDATEIIDGSLLAIWEHMRRVYWLPVTLTLFFCLTGASNWIGGICSLVTATLFCMLLAFYGIGCSLSARTFAGALVPTFVFPLVINAGIPFLIPIFRNASGPALWTLSSLMLVVSWLALRRRTVIVTVALYLLAVHLVVASAATCWTWNYAYQLPHGKKRPAEEYPILAMHPGAITIATLDGRAYNRWFWRGPEWYRLLPAYWLGLVVNIIWVRRWLIRNFDRLAGRTDRAGHSMLRTVA